MLHHVLRRFVINAILHICDKAPFFCLSVDQSSLTKIPACHSYDAMTIDGLISDYTMHDYAYQKRRKDGYPGWDDEETLAQSRRDVGLMLTKLDLSQMHRVLDIGCGAGNLSFWLEEMGFEVFGCDVSEAAIDWAGDLARKRESRVDFRVADATKASGYESDYFDLVVDNHCLHCIIGEDRECYLRELRRVLKPGAFYILSTMCSDESSYYQPEGYDPNSRCIILRGRAIRYLGEATQIKREIQDAGFSIIHSETKSGEGAELFLIARKAGESV